MSSKREIVGTVVCSLPGALYRVRGDDGTLMTASLGGVARQTTVKIIPGDRVVVVVSPYDPARGRIKERVRPA